jgi:hypothetical protein
MSHVRCIADSHADAQGKTWCGRSFDLFEFTFTSIDHAAMNGRNGGYLTVCKKCQKAVIAGLQNKESA